MKLGPSSQKDKPIREAVFKLRGISGHFSGSAA